MSGQGGSMGYRDSNLARLREAKALIRAFLLQIEHGKGCGTKGLLREPCDCKFKALVLRARTLLARED